MKKTVVSVATLTAITGVAATAVSADEYIISSGDTLWGIASEVGTSVADLKADNELSSDIIFPGDVLTVNPEEEAAPAPASNESSYIVKPGDTLWAIGAEFSLDYNEIKKWNNLSSDLIFVGQEISIDESAVSAPAVEEAPAVETVEEPVVEEVQEVEPAAEVVEEPVAEEVQEVEPAAEVVEEPVVAEVQEVEPAEEVVEEPVVEEVQEVEPAAEVVEEPVVEEVQEVEPAAEVVEEPVEVVEEPTADEIAAEQAEADRIAAEEAAAQEAEAAEEAAAQEAEAAEEAAAEQAEADRIAAEEAAAQEAEAAEAAAEQAEAAEEAAAKQAEADRIAAAEQAEADRIAAEEAAAQEAEAAEAAAAEADRIAAEEAAAQEAEEAEQAAAERAAEQAAAEEAEEQPAAATPVSSASNGKNYYSWGTCAWYVFEKRSSMGMSVGNTWGDAKNWASNAQSAGYSVNNSPSVGAIMQAPAYTNGSYGQGHVAIVERVNGDGSILVSEMQFGGGLGDQKTRTISASQVSSHNFIH